MTVDIRTQVLTFDQVRQALQALPDYILPDGTREWSEQASDIGTPATSGNWAFYFKSGGLFLRDDLGNITGPLVDAASSGGLTSAYTDMTDGTTTASASGGDTFKFRTANGMLTIAVGSNDATHGDNALFTIVPSVIAGAMNFIEISDTPSSYTGEQFQFATVNEAESAIEFSEFSLDFLTKTSSYSMGDDDSVILADASSGPMTIILPLPQNTKRRVVVIKKIDNSSNPVTISTL